MLCNREFLLTLAWPLHRGWLYISLLSQTVQKTVFAIPPSLLGSRQPVYLGLRTLLFNEFYVIRIVHFLIYSLSIKINKMH